MTRWLAPHYWIKDDGSPFPLVKLFESENYDSDSKTFTGTINWSDSPIDGDVRWEYKIIFGEDFLQIIGGWVKSYDIEGTRTTTRFSKNSDDSQTLSYSIYEADLAAIMQTGEKIEENY